MIRKAVDLGRLLRDARVGPERLRSLRDRKLSRLIHHAVSKVPYYKDLFAGAGIRPEDVSTVDHLARIPLTRKQDLRNAGLSNTVMRGVDLSGCRRWLTSGSTGEPFAAHQRRSEARRRALLELRALLGVGFRPWDRLAVLGPEHAFPRPWHERLGLYRALVVPIELGVEEQLHALGRFAPTILWAYPTALEAIHHQGHGRLSDVIRPRLLVSSAEMLDQRLRAEVVEDLGVEVFNFYGCFEIGRIAAECRSHRGLHVNADHVVLEILDDDRPPPPGEPGVVVVTDLDNLTQPFIRYRLGDLCSLMTDPCPCGSSFPLLSAPEGRENDMLHLPGGRRITPFRINFVVRRFLEIRRFLAVQSAPDQLCVSVVLEGPMTDRRRYQLRSELEETVGAGVTVDVRVVRELPSVAGKPRSVIRRFAGEGDGEETSGE